MAIKTYARQELPFEERLKDLVWRFTDEQRMSEGLDGLESAAALMLYCTYISDNHQLLRIVGFEDAHSMRSVRSGLGDRFLITDVLAYYATLRSAAVELPELDLDCLIGKIQARTVSRWAEKLSESGLSFEDSEGYPVAKSILTVLSDSDFATRFGHAYGELRSSRTLSELVVSLAGAEGKRVVDPVCGCGTMLATAASVGAAEVFGMDINPLTANLAKIVCFFGSPDCPADIECGDTTIEGVNLPGDAGCVLAAPPVGMRIFGIDEDARRHYASVFGSIAGADKISFKTFEDFCVAKAIGLLADDGTAIVQVAPNFLFKSQRDSLTLRKALVESGYLQAVVELPGGAMFNTSIKSALLVLGKKRKYDDVLLVDLDSKELAKEGLFIKDRRRVCEFTEKGIEWVVDTVSNRKEIERVSIAVKPEELEPSGYSLHFSAHGKIVDVAAMLEGVRSAKEIIDDINNSQDRVTQLDKTISILINSIEKKGE